MSTVLSTTDSRIDFGDDATHRAHRKHSPPKELIEGMKAFADGRIGADALDALFDAAVADTIRLFEETGSPAI
jgi:hypothetical protein